MRLASLKIVVKARSVSNDMVAVCLGIGQNVTVIGTSGALGRVGKEESQAAAEQNINDRSEWGVSDELRSNLALVITVVDVRGEASRGGVLYIYETVRVISLGVKVRTVIRDVTTKPVLKPAAAAASKTVPQGSPFSFIATPPLKVYTSVVGENSQGRSWIFEILAHFDRAGVGGGRGGRIGNE